MALQLVGQTSGQGTGASYTISLNGTLTGGIASSPSAGDIVIVASGFGATAGSTPVITGNNNGSYPAIHANLYSNDTWDTDLRSFYDIQGSTVDTQLTVTRANNTTYGGVTIVQVWRGVDSVTPLDVTATTAVGTNGSRPDAPAITPTTAGCVVFAAGSGTQGVTGTSAFVIPSNMTAGLSVLSTGGSTSQLGTFLAYYNAWTSGAFNPNAATGGATSTSSSWCAATFVLRPFVAVDHATTGTLTGQLGSVVGSAQSNALHTTTGVLAGQGSVITGDADREAAIIPHTTDGALVGQGSIVTGSADTAQIRTSSGALVGQGSLLAGDADHEVLVIPHVTTGVLVGDASDINGTANRTRQHLTSGVLAGQTATITGSAERIGAVVDHETTGDLVGSGSVITGEATRTEKVTHETSGTLVGSGSIVTGKAKNESASTEVTGASVTRRQRQPSLVIVEVDGKEYRVQQSQLNAFLNQVKQEAKADAQQPVKKAKKKRKNVIVEEPKQEIQIVVKSIPVNIIPEISAKIQQTNLLISQYYAKAMERHLSDMDDEEVLLMLI